MRVSRENQSYTNQLTTVKVPLIKPARTHASSLSFSSPPPPPRPDRADWRGELERCEKAPLHPCRAPSAAAPGGRRAAVASLSNAVDQDDPHPPRPIDAGHKGDPRSPRAVPRRPASAAPGHVLHKTRRGRHERGARCQQRE